MNNSPVRDRPMQRAQEDVLAAFGQIEKALRDGDGVLLAGLTARRTPAGASASRALAQHHIPDCGRHVRTDNPSVEEAAMSRFLPSPFIKIVVILALLLPNIAVTARAQQAIMDAGELDPATIAKFQKKPSYSPYANRTYPTRVFWGDEHLHTAWSADAGMTGATLTPEDALRFAAASRSSPAQAKR